VKYWEKTLTRSGFAIASLEEPWVAGKLEMPHEKLLTDIRLLTADDRLISGADVYLYVTRRIWWAWPFYAIFSLPGFNRLIQVGYRWFARNRYCVSHACRIQPR
jgi:predicted DCC family thiol-disulfide oxidoreductase YuxK